jgi:hypothetical protein
MTQHTFPDFRGNDHPQNPNPMPPHGMSFNMGAPDPDSTIISNKRLKRTKRRWLWVIPGFLGGLLVGMVSNPEDAKAPTAITTLPSIEASTPGKVTPGVKKPAPPAVKTYMAQNGVYLVPDNVEPGTYRNGSTDTDLCAWMRLKGTGGDAEDIITGGFGPNQVVTIKKTDKAFKVTGCGPWVLVK